jgi:hypothetical protein
MHKTTWVHAFAWNLLFIGIVAKLRGIFESHAPLGYQDASGFHYGVKKAVD